MCSPSPRLRVFLRNLLKPVSLRRVAVALGRVGAGAFAIRGEARSAELGRLGKPSYGKKNK